MRRPATSVHSRDSVGRQLDVRQYKQGTLVIDIIDAKRRELVWRGAISGEIEKRGPSDEQLNEALGKVFANFPPAS